MTASASIAGTVRTIPDAPSAPPPHGGVPTYANFQSVLEQYRAPRESESKSDDNQDTRQQKNKEPDPASALAVTQPVTAAEAPRLILPFTTSIKFRQDTTASPGDTAPDDARASSEAARTMQDSAATADPNIVPPANATASPTPAIFRSSLDLPGFRLESDPKTNSAPGGTQRKLPAKLQATFQPTSKDSVPAKTAAPLAATALVDPSAAALPVTTSTTVQQATTAVQISSTADEASDTASTSTPALDRAACILTNSSNTAAQHRPSRDSGSATASTSRPVQQQQRKISDSSAAITVPVPVTETVDAQRLIHSPAGSNTPGQDAPVSQSSSAATQSSSTTSGIDSKTAMPPVIERTGDATAAPPTGTLAFAARLSPTEETPAPELDANRTTDSQTRPQTMLQSPVTARQTISQADVQSDAHAPDSGNPSADQEKMSERFAKLETLFPQTHATTTDPPAAAPASSTSLLSVAARMDQMQEAPPVPSSGNHDITIRIPDATTDQGTAVRLVERAGEVHVSVRTSDTEMAQTLRSSLNDLVTRLEDGGIRTQVWQPGADASTSQNNSQQSFADSNGSKGRQYSSGSNSEQESKQQNKPRWVEALEGSIGSQNSKETPQLWQA